MFYMLIGLFMLALVGLVFLNQSIKHAATGYEDEFGFHEGSDPHRSPDRVFGTQRIEVVQVGQKNARSTRRVLERAAKQAAEHRTPVASH
jgi:hypothetical protein